MSSGTTPSIDRGDKITTNMAEIVTEGKPIVVKWSQNFVEKKKDFYSGTFTNTTKPGKSGIVFVEKDMISEFNKLVKDGTITVDTNFQYGQKDSTGANRWIVFHNKTDKPYQHRFGQGVYDAKSKTALEVLEKMGFSAAEGLAGIESLVKNWIGNPLREFGA